MPATAKKYKLLSAAGGAEKQPCAFFATERGCRSGDSCKFAHVNPHEKADVADMVVSSESSDGEESVVQEQPNGAGKSKQQQQNVKMEESPFMSASEAKKAGKKNKRGVDENPFASPQQAKKQKASAAPATPAAPKTTPKAKKTKPPKQQQNKSAAAASTYDFRSLDLPIASFTMPGTDDTAAKETKAAEKPVEPVPAVPETTELPIPTSTAAGRKWLDVVKQTRENSRYKNIYDLTKYMEQDRVAGYATNTWVKTQPFDNSRANYPQVIAIDCEMCETQDPVSGQKDPRALCRVSIIDAEKDEVLLDSLVKPMWPVTDYRTWVNGIAAENLENVQFTLRHAQAFMMALCSEETVILGHAVHNDLAAMRIDHPTVADSACLFAAADSETATVALRDLAAHVLQTTMPDKHDSVNDARISYKCLEFYRAAEGKVEAVPRTAKPSRADYACQLFVHRIPKNACDEAQLSKMFLAHTSIQPAEVEEIVYTGTSGKTHVNFKSGRHGSLAFDSLEGKAVADASGRLQKKVFLKNGNYIRIRKMAFERKEKDGDQPDTLERRLSS